MEYRPLSNTDLRVSVICLGTMTWGEQNSEQEAHQQLDCAMARGVNFSDLAEMYPVPPKAETQGLTERYFGNWLAKRSDRERLIIATKVSGPGMQSYLRGGPQLTRAHIMQAVDDSLQRIGSDYIDLYQVHWPARSTNFFGKLGYQHAETDDAKDTATPIAETLEVLHDLVQAGKVRYVGISNETPWGTMHYLRCAEQHHWPRIVSVQNPYGLLNRVFEIGLAEIAHRESVGLLAYSPLGFGVLSGKYRGGAKPDKARLTRFAFFDRYSNPLGIAATERYCALAEEAGLDPAQMALAYVNSRPFLTSNIIGATTMAQLESNLDSADLKLSGDVLEAIEKIHTEVPNPCP